MASHHCLILVFFCAFWVGFCQGLQTWAPRCCRKGMHKAVISKGDPDVCNHDDLDRRSQFKAMERMICRCQDKSCMPRRAHIGGDDYVECCDCCKLGIKARFSNTNCSTFNILFSSITNPCAKVFVECCNGVTPAPPLGTLPPPGTRPPPPSTSKAPASGCAKLNCQHICRESNNGIPMCYCRRGFSLTNDKESCVGRNECCDQGGNLPLIRYTNNTTRYNTTQHKHNTNPSQHDTTRHDTTQTRHSTAQHDTIQHKHYTAQHKHETAMIQSHDTNAR
ncbi:predicted protein [Nematostella vectensis]|uniref:Anaphylatoxin-like domain-containing protein n=1 Tax=Nematostella vectensis TaxID=45351 RepID=A7RVN3_NEMVE|nr:predicted protein [Nematostella vectensis]|eukprot:XP_001636479.1 predicted protein [Nematostella vectensis]